MHLTADTLIKRNYKYLIFLDNCDLTNYFDNTIQQYNKKIRRVQIVVVDHSAGHLRMPGHGVLQDYPRGDQ